MACANLDALFAVLVFGAILGSMGTAWLIYFFGGD